MGEDSCKNPTTVEKQTASVNSDCAHQRQHLSSTMSSCSEADSESTTTSSFADTIDEEVDQDYQYGPGIVSKLRTKFLSISLKQSRGFPATMRRSCSLENMLEPSVAFADNGFPSSKLPVSNTNNISNKTTWNNLKRAKSMDTLLAGLEDNTNDVSEAESDRTSDLNTNDINQRKPKLIKRRDGPLNRPTVTICDEEFPKPDIVKTYKRMFEPAESKKVTANSNVRRRPPVLRATAKSGSLSVVSKSGTNQINNKINGTMPAATPSTPVKSISTAKPKFSAKELVNNNVEGHAAIRIGNNVKNESKSVKEVTYLNNHVSDLNRKNAKNEHNGIVANDLTRTSEIIKNELPQTKQREGIIKRNLRAPKYLEGTDVKPPVSIVKQGVKKNILNSNVQAAEKKIICKVSVKDFIKNEIPDPAVKKPLVKIKSNFAKASEKFTKLELNNISVKKSEIQPKVVPTEGNNIKPAVPPKQNQLTGPLNSDKPLVNGFEHMNSISANEQLLDQESKPTESPINNICHTNETIDIKKVVNGSSTSCANTMVFDFRGKNVVSHLSIQPAPFGCKAIPSRKRTVIIDGKESVPYLNGFANGGSTALEDSEDDDFVDYSVPSPCGLVFEGENVKVGKGALLSTRNKALKIQFNEDVEKSTFVYPSELSLLAEDSSSSDFSSLDGTDASTISNTATTTSINSSTVNSSAKLRANTAISSNGAGGLMSYTPSVLRTVDNFQPGSFRAQDKDEKKTKKKGEVGVNENGTATEEGEEENREGGVINGDTVDNEQADAMLKPADPEFISSWSLSTSTSDLLF